MPNKALFAPARTSAPAADAVNEAGGMAYSFTARHALAQLAATGTFNNVFYSTAEEQFEKVLELLPVVGNEFIAKVAVFSRERGQMKDMPAALVAYLAANDIRLAGAIFHRVIDNPKMLRNFVQFIRSGKFGRKSLGTAPKRWVQEWFAKRTPDNIFRASVGNDPSLADVIKLARPKPTDAERDALYAYLIQSKNHEAKAISLPQLVKNFEAFKGNMRTFSVPDVPFEMLTALPLDTNAWKRLAKNMSWTQLRMSLNTLKRHNVLEDHDMVRFIADVLKDPFQVKRAKPFPYQLLAAYKAVEGSDLPREILEALQDALEVSLELVPTIPGKVIVCPDVSGSMASPVTGYREGSTTKVSCVDVAALVGASILKQNPISQIIAFDNVLHIGGFNPRDSLMTNATKLAAFGGGGTACQLPLKYLNDRNEKADLVIYVSDNESWMQFEQNRSRFLYSRNPAPETPPMAEEWLRFKKRNPNAKLVLLDIQPYDTTQVRESKDVLNIGGFGDYAFEMIAKFYAGELSSEHWVGEIEKIIL